MIGGVEAADGTKAADATAIATAAIGMASLVGTEIGDEEITSPSLRNRGRSDLPRQLSESTRSAFFAARVSHILTQYDLDSGCVRMIEYR